jgi:hypothetical protein
MTGEAEHFAPDGEVAFAPRHATPGRRGYAVVYLTISSMAFPNASPMR